MTSAPPSTTESEQISAGRVSLGGSHLKRLSMALEGAFTLEQLRQLLRVELDGVTVTLDSVVAAVHTSNMHDICHNLVLWALRDERVGLRGLLGAALSANPSNPDLLALEEAWKGIEFAAPDCPYPGMRPFTADEEGRFYGRQDEIVQVIERLHRLQGADRARLLPVVAVVGPSGSGKSSLLAAGIAPRLKKSDLFGDKRWDIREMRPGATPYDSLVKLLELHTPPDAPDNTRNEAHNGSPEHAAQTLHVAEGTLLLLVVDQLEELFTTSSPEQRRQFEQALLTLFAVPDFFVMVASRPDFYTHITIADSPLWPRIAPDYRLEIMPPRDEALGEAIACPAIDVGVAIEDELVERLRSDAGEEPGMLPFVQETLRMLWLDAADSWVIDLSAYTSLIGDKSGRSGLQVALALQAEDVYLYDLATDAERTIARRILLRLVQFGRGRSDTRRQQTVEQLRSSQDDSTFDHVLAVLTENNLLTLSDEAQRVDLAHEALIHGWPRLRQWIESKNEAEMRRRGLERRAAKRLRRRQENAAGGFLDNIELAEAKQWVAGPDALELGVSNDLTALIAESQAEIDRVEREKQAAAQRELEQIQALAKAAEEQRAAQELAALSEARRAVEAEQSADKLRKRNRWLMAAMAAVAVLLIVTVLFSISARVAEAIAENRRMQAESAARRTMAETMAAGAQLRMKSDGLYDDVSLLLARDAVLITRNSPDRYVTANAEAALREAVRGIVPWRTILPANGVRHQGRVNAVAFRHDGSLAVSGGSDGTVRLWNATTLRPLAMLTGHSESVTSVAFSPDGSTVASGSTDNTVRLWNTQTGQEIAVLERRNQDVNAVTFSPNGKTLASGYADGVVWVRNVESKRLSEMTPLTTSVTSFTSLAFSPDGKLLAGGDVHRTVHLWDVATGERLATLEGHTGAVTSVAFSPDGNTLASGSLDGTIRVWSIQVGRQRSLPQRMFALGVAAHADDEPSYRLARRLVGHLGPIYSVAFSPDGTLAGGGAKTTQLWDARTGQPLRTLAGHSSGVAALSFSPDGRSLFSGSWDSTVRLWDTQTGGQLRTVQGHTRPVNAVAFNPDGNILASGGSDFSVRLWDVQTGQQLRSLAGHEGRVNSLAFSSDGVTLASGGQDGTVVLWDVRANTLLYKLEAHTLSVTSVAFSPDGGTLATSSRDGTVRLWDATTGDPQAELQPPDEQPGASEKHANWVNSVAFSPDGSLLASGGADTVRLWNVQTGKHLRAVQGSPGAIFAVAFSPDGSTLASGGRDGAVRLWDVQTGEQLSVFNGKYQEADEKGMLMNDVTSVAFSPDGKILAGSSWDRTVRLWDVEKKEQIAVKEHADWVNAVTFSPDGLTLASGSWDHTARMWDTIAPKTLNELRSGVIQPEITAVEFNREGTLLVSSSGGNRETTGDSATGDSANNLNPRDAVVQLWDMRTGAQLHTLQRSTDPLFSVVFSPDGRMVAGSGLEQTVQLWNVQSGHQLSELEGGMMSVNSLAFSPDGSMLAGGSIYSTVLLWNVYTGEIIDMLEGHDGPVHSVAFSPDGSTLASGSEDKTIRLWDVRTGEAIRKLEGHAGAVNRIAFSPAGNILASGSGDMSVRLWNVQTGKRLRLLEGHTGPVSSVAFSPDGKVLASSSSEDDVMRLWNVQTGEQLPIVEDGHTSGVTALAFSPDGNTIATGRWDGTVQLRPATIDVLLSMAEQRIQRPIHLLTTEERGEWGLLE